MQGCNDERVWIMVTSTRKSANRPKDQPPGSAAKVVLAVAVAIAVGLLFALTRLGSEDESAERLVDEPSTTDVREVKKQEDSTPIAPEFEFYTLLPEQVPSRPERPEPRVVPDEPVPAIDDEVAPAEEDDEAVEYIIQAGSFAAESDAERRKAELALLGYASEVRAAEVGEQTFYRVFVGPLSGTARAREAQQRMSEADIETMPPRQINE